MPTASSAGPLPGASSHPSHDLTVLAALSDPDAAPADRAAAETLAGSCPTCAAIVADVQALRAALRDLPPAIAVPRDFRLTPDQAARLRRGSAWQRLLRPFGAGGIAGLRPLGAALTTLGLAGILLTASPLVPSAAAPRDASTGVFGASVGPGALAPASAPVAPPSSVTKQQGAGPNNGGDTGAGQGDEASPSGGPQTVLPVAGSASQAATTAGGAGGMAPAGPTESFGGGLGGGLSPLTWLSLATLLAGLAILGLRLAARRLA